MDANPRIVPGSRGYGFSGRANIRRSRGIIMSLGKLAATLTLPFTISKISYSGYRYPPAIIQQAIWLNARSTLPEPRALPFYL